MCIRICRGVREVTKKRGIVVSRSTFPGSGKEVGHWLGDNSATWQDLRASIVGMIEFNMFGFAYVGADICGFFGNTHEELCLRWMQLGAFYPYARNHNTKGAVDHDPGKWPVVGSVSREVLRIRYTLLPHLYTLHFSATTKGEAVIRAVAFEFPADKMARAIDDQFLWGRSLMIAPIVYPGNSSRDVYLPDAVWYDFHQGHRVIVDETRILRATPSIATVPLYVRGDSILPLQQPAANTMLSRNKPLGLLVSPNSTGQATGQLFWDDGESIDTINRGDYLMVHLHYQQNNVQWIITRPNTISKHLRLGFLRIFNVTRKPSMIFQDGHRIVSADIHYVASSKVLEVFDLDLDVSKSFTLSWTDEISAKIPCPISYAERRNDSEKLTEPKCITPCQWNSTHKIQCSLPPLNEFGYKIAGRSRSTDFGFRISLERISSDSLFGEDIPEIEFEVFQYSASLLRFKMTDPSNPDRYEVPLQLNIPTEQKNEEPVFDFFLVDQNIGAAFAFYVTRKQTGTIVFDTRAVGLVFSNQFLSITTLLASKNVYGLGENNHRTFRHDLNSKTWPIFARDQPPQVQENMQLNLYGSHPFYQVIENDGNSHGVLFLNSNAIDYQLLDYPSLTLRTIGGILDFFIFFGPQPEAVVAQYTHLIGRPALPPYWGLGFHVSRYGYKNTEHVKQVLERTRRYNIPQDIQFADIDMMDRRMDFTLDPENFHDIPQLVQELHRRNMKFVPILDPAINSEMPAHEYPTYTRGLDKNVYMTWPQNISHAHLRYNNKINNLILGFVWPDNRTAFPNFHQISAHQWWTSEILRYFNRTVQFDGLWIDMNEPAVFDTNMNEPWNWPKGRPAWNLKCDINKWDDPPYVTKAASLGPSFRMSDKTVCLSCMETPFRHYDTHNLYGWSQVQATVGALRKMNDQRAFLVTRSSYVGTGQWAGHWLGDNQAIWEDMHRSIIGMLEFNLFGMPFVGADICGFFGDTTEELCQRWMQLGAFYPFARSHNGKGYLDQDPGVWESVAISSRKVLNIRYSLLPYLYTLFFLANTEGGTVVRPLHHEFPTDRVTYPVDTQFLWGSALMISPVLEPGAIERKIYFPFDAWYDYTTGAAVEWAGESMLVAAPADVIPLHVRGGSIIPRQQPALTTFDSRSNAFNLVVALGLDRKAHGKLFWDNGQAHDTIPNHQYDLIRFTFDQDKLTSYVGTSGAYVNDLKLETIDLFGVEHKPARILVNGNVVDEANIQYDDRSMKLTVKVYLTLKYAFSIAFEGMWP